MDKDKHVQYVHVLDKKLVKHEHASPINLTNRFTILGSSAIAKTIFLLF